MCPSCAGSKKQRLYSYHKATFHEYAASSVYVKPAIAVACNSGVHEECQDSWRESIKVIMQQKIPMVFTSYNESEAEGELGTAFSVFSGGACLIKVR